MTGDEATGPSLYFLHIPKTAGTSLTTLIQRHFSTDETLSEATVWNEFWQLRRGRVRRSRFVRGHFGFSMVKLLGPQFETLTVLRDPVERVISMFEHTRVTPSQRFHHLVQTEGMGLAEFVRHPRTRGVVTNMQARHVGQDLPLERLWHEPEYVESSGDNETLHRSPELGADALANLDRIALVGVTEHFELFQLALCRRFGWQPDAHAPRRRGRSTPRHQPDPETLEIIRDGNRLDEALHARAGERLVELLADTFARPAAEVATAIATSRTREEMLEEFSRTCAEHYTRRMTASLARRFSWHADMAISGSGWHDVHGKRNESHRWSGPGTRSTFDVPVLPGKKYWLDIHLLRAITPEVLDSLVVRVGEHMVEIDTIEHMSDRIYLSGTVPGHATRSHAFLTIVFEVASTHSPAELGTNPHDTLVRGIALLSVEVSPASLFRSRGARD